MGQNSQKLLKVWTLPNWHWWSSGPVFLKSNPEPWPWRHKHRILLDCNWFWYLSNGPYHGWIWPMTRKPKYFLSWRRNPSRWFGNWWWSPGWATQLWNSFSTPKKSLYSTRLQTWMPSVRPTQSPNFNSELKNFIRNTYFVLVPLHGNDNKVELMTRRN